MITYEQWLQLSYRRRDHIGELLRKFDRCDPMHGRAYRAARFTTRYCPWWPAWLLASYRQEVFGMEWKPEY